MTDNNSADKTKIDADNLQVTNNIGKSRFEVEVDGSVGFAEYTLTDDTIVFTSTEVPSELEGQGIGSKLVRTGLDHARKEDLHVWPTCPFVKSYIDRHPEYQELVPANPPE